MKKLQIFAPGFQAQTTSIEFNGVDEQMESSTATLGIANVWSIMVWMRRRGDANGLANRNTILFLDGDPSNSLSISSRGDLTGDPMRIRFTESTGLILLRDFDFTQGTFLPFDQWAQVILTWDGTDFTVYGDGVATTPTSSGFNAGSMTDTTRTVTIGENPNAPFPLSGFVHSVAIWDADITSAVAEIYNGGTASTFNLRTASFNANLQHWWRLGQDTTDLGKDSGKGTLIDVDENSTNITSDDIVSESPA